MDGQRAVRLSATNETQDGVTKVAVQKGHRALFDTARKTISHNKICAATQRFEHSR